MSITIHIHYTGAPGAAQAFAREMLTSGTVDAIHREPGNEGYAYYLPMDDPAAVLLVDRWRDQAALDAHHASSMMETIAALRDKYDLHMQVERFVSTDSLEDERFIRR